MKFNQPKSKKLWIDLSLFVLTGVITASAIVFMLVSEKIGAMQITKWQMAVIYFAMVALCMRLGMKKYVEASAEDELYTNS